MKITQIKGNDIAIPRKKRVAAYARVSADYDMTEHSLSQQISYYNSLIQSRPDWIFSGIYSDLGISGTQTKRDGFLNMMQSARNGKIDLILTKSISRFARNTIDLLNTIRELKELGVIVHFERENIDSTSLEGEFLLTLLASFAQEESHSISENVKWSIRKDFENGKNHTARLYGYDRKDGEFIINEKEADVVRLIFNEYLKGNSPDGISKLLTSKGIKSPTGNANFGYTKVCDILREIAYTGDMILQKTYKENHLTHRKMKNNGELTKYFVEDALPPIISKETFSLVEEEIERRRKLGIKANRSLSFSPFTSKVVCSSCGRTYRKRMKGKNNVWICGGKLEHGAAVSPCVNIPEPVLYSLTEEVLSKENFSEADFDLLIDHIEVRPERKLIYHLTNGRKITKTWQVDKNNHVIKGDGTNG